MTSTEDGDFGDAKPGAAKAAGTASRTAVKGADAPSQADVGSALRNAFQATVDEQVPQDLLDLLRRLD